MNKDANISILYGLVHLVTKLAIQIKSLDVACDSWDTTLQIILEFHRSFLDKTLLVYNPLTSMSKMGRKTNGGVTTWGRKHATIRKEQQENKRVSIEEHVLSRNKILSKNR